MVFVWLALVAFFVASARGTASAASATPAASAASAAAPLINQQAFYVIFDYQVNNQSFPGAVCQNDGEGEQGGLCVYNMDSTYKNGIIIAQPMNMTTTMTDKMRSTIPGSKIFAYWCIEFIPIYTDECSTGHIMGDRDGRNCSTTYKCTDGQTPEFNRLVNDAFPKSMAKRQLVAGMPPALVCGYKGQATYVMAEASAESLAKMLSSVVLAGNFDGIYLDGYLNPATYKAPKFAEGARYDFNGDGLPDSPEDVVAQYKTYTPMFVQRLRDLMGPSKLIIANSAGANPDPNLNGLTIEMEACLDYDECTSALIENEQKGAKPTTSALWLTHSEAMTADEQCQTAAKIQAQLPYVQVGTDFFDGSAIKCTNVVAAAT